MKTSEIIYGGLWVASAVQVAGYTWQAMSGQYEQFPSVDSSGSGSSGGVLGGVLGSTLDGITGAGSSILGGIGSTIVRGLSLLSNG
jgi:hypothetical protein